MARGRVAAADAAAEAAEPPDRAPEAVMEVVEPEIVDVGATDDDFDVNKFRKERRSRLRRKANARSGQSIVWNLTIYSIFVGIFTYVNIRAMTSSGESLFSFYLTDAVRDQTLTGAGGEDFADINDLQDVYRWLNNRLLPGLLDESFDRGKAAEGTASSLEPQEDPYDVMAECDFKGEPCSAENYTTALVMRFNHLIGGVRLRSQRVKNCTYDADAADPDECPAALQDTWCKVHDHFRAAIQERTRLRCYPEVETAGFTLEVSDLLTSRDFGPDGRFQHSSASETGEARHLSAGLWNWYPGSGYVVDLPMDLEEATETVFALQDDDFLDEQTRVLFVDFTVFNPIHNLFTVVRATFEIPSIGRFIPTYSIRTIKIYSVTDRDKRIEWLEYVLLLFINLYALREVVEMVVLGPRRYFMWFDALCPHCLRVLQHSHDDVGHRCCSSCAAVVTKESDIKTCELWMEELMLDAFMCRGCLDVYHKLTPKWWLAVNQDETYRRHRDQIIKQKAGEGTGKGKGEKGKGEAVSVVRDCFNLVKRLFKFEVFLLVRTNAVSNSLTHIPVPPGMNRRAPPSEDAAAEAGEEAGEEDADGGSDAEAKDDGRRGRRSRRRRHQRAKAKKLAAREQEHVHALFRCNHCLTHIPNAMRSHVANCAAAKAAAEEGGGAPEVKPVRGWSGTAWNLLDIVVLSALMFSMYQRLITRRQFEDELDDLYAQGKFPQEYHSFQDVADYLLYNNSVNAVNALLIYLKFFKYLGVVPGIAGLSRTIGKSLLNVTYFLIILSVLLLGFGTAFHIVFGTEVEAFATVPQSVVTLILYLLGDYDYRELVAVTRLAPVLFMMWMLLGFFVLVNVFIAIIMEAYEEAQKEVALDSHAVAAFFEDTLKRTKASRAMGWLRRTCVPHALSRFYASHGGGGGAAQQQKQQQQAEERNKAVVLFADPPRKPEEVKKALETAKVEALVDSLSKICDKLDLEAEVRESRQHVHDSAAMVAASQMLKTAVELLQRPVTGT